MEKIPRRNRKSKESDERMPFNSTTTKQQPFKTLHIMLFTSSQSIDPYPLVPTIFLYTRASLLFFLFFSPRMYLVLCGLTEQVQREREREEVPIPLLTPPSISHDDSLSLSLSLSLYFMRAPKMCSLSAIQSSCGYRRVRVARENQISLILLLLLLLLTASFALLPLPG